MKYPKGPYLTTVYIDDAEFDNVAVYYTVTQDDPDTGMTGGIELFGAYFEDRGDILDDMSQRQIEDIEAEIADYVSDWCAGYLEEQAEYRNELRKDNDHA